MRYKQRGFIPLVALIVLGLLALAGGTAAVIAFTGNNSASQHIEATVGASTTPDAPQSTVEANNETPVSFTDAEVAELELKGKVTSSEVSATVLSQGVTVASIQQSCLEREGKLYQEMLAEFLYSGTGALTLANQQTALAKSLYPDSMPSLTAEEKASLTNEQKKLVDSGNVDKIRIEIDSVAYQRTKADQQSDNLSRIFDPYNMRLRCGQVSTEEQVAHSLQELTDELKKLIK